MSTQHDTGLQVTSWSPDGNARTVHVVRRHRVSLLDMHGAGRIPLRWRVRSAMAALPATVASLARTVLRGLRPLPSTALAR